MASFEEYASFLKGKSLILVGPAGYLEGSGFGEWIDSFDLVVRTNWSVPVPPGLERDIGSKCDILYKRLLKLGHLDELAVKEYEAAGLSWVVAIDRQPTNTPNMTHFINAIQGSSLRWITGAQTRTQLRGVLNTSPFAGVVAIQDLLRYPIKSLMVTGNDFYQTGYQTGYGGTRYRESMGRKEGHPGSTHDIPKQMEFLRQRKRQDSRLDFDERLTRILEADKMKKLLKEVAIVIPARAGSRRFPNKPLAQIAGEAMIVRVCKQAGLVGADVYVATDSKEIAEVVEAAGFQALMTTEASTGTDRVAQAARLLKKKTLFINVQGDEPLIDPAAIKAMISAKKNEPGVVFGAVSKLSRDPEDLSVVKVAMEESGELRWASRHPIGQWQQAGLYAFTRKELEDFQQKKLWELEAAESIEILRFLKLGYPVKMVRLEEAGISVDLPEHIQLVEEKLNGQR